MSLDVTENEYRYRIVDPNKYDPNSFRYKDISDGVAIVTACPVGQYEGGRCKVGVETQAYRFNKERFKDEEQVRGWIDKNIREETPTKGIDDVVNDALEHMIKMVHSRDHLLDRGTLDSEHMGDDMMKELATIREELIKAGVRQEEVEHKALIEYTKRNQLEGLLSLISMKRYYGLLAKLKSDKS